MGDHGGTQTTHPLQVQSVHLHIHTYMSVHGKMCVFYVQDLTAASCFSRTPSCKTCADVVRQQNDQMHTLTPRSRSTCWLQQSQQWGPTSRQSAGHKKVKKECT